MTNRERLVAGILLMLLTAMALLGQFSSSDIRVTMRNTTKTLPDGLYAFHVDTSGRFLIERNTSANGTFGTTVQAIAMSGSTFTIQAPDATWSLKFPTSLGTSGYTLTTDGAGVTSWTSVGGGDGFIPITSTPTVNSGLAVSSIFGSATVISFPTAADSSVTVQFHVPSDADVAEDIVLGLNYISGSAPGVTDNKIRVKITCIVNGSAAAETVGDTITLANNTTPAEHVGVVNICAGGTLTSNDFIQVNVKRDVSVTNNAAINWGIAELWFTYTR